MITMKEIQVTLYATLRKYHPHQEGSKPFTMEMADGDTLGQLQERLKIPPRESKQTFVNNRRQDDGYLLQPGDKIAIFPPIAGG